MRRVEKEAQEEKLNVGEEYKENKWKEDWKKDRETGRIPRGIRYDCEKEEGQQTRRRRRRKG